MHDIDIWVWLLLPPVINQVNMQHCRLSERERQWLSNVHRPQTWVLALLTDLINVLMAPSLQANEQIMRSSPAVLKSTHFKISIAVITSSILREFGYKPICPTPCAPISLPSWCCWGLIFSYGHDTLGSGCHFSSLQTHGNCHVGLGARGSSVHIAVSLFSGAGAVLRSHGAWSTSLCVQFLETSSLAVLTLTSVLFSSCCTCFSIAANSLNTDSAKHQHTAFKTSPLPNIPPE